MNASTDKQVSDKNMKERWKTLENKWLKSRADTNSRTKSNNNNRQQADRSEILDFIHIDFYDIFDHYQSKMSPNSTHDVRTVKRYRWRWSGCVGTTHILKCIFFLFLYIFSFELFWWIFSVFRERINETI